MSILGGIGHSIVAAAAILTASHRHDIDLVIVISGFAHPNLVMGRHLDTPWLPRLLQRLILNYVQWVIGFSFDDIAPMNRIAHVQCPVLLAHGTADTQYAGCADILTWCWCGLSDSDSCVVP